MNKKRSSDSTPWYIPKITENICPHKRLFVSVHSRIIHNSQKVTQPKRPSVDGRVNKMWYIHNEYYLAI